MPVTPAFEAGLFKRRREEVLRRMRELSPHGMSVAVFPGMPVATRNNDVEHPYRADSDVFFLTGFEEPEAVAVLSTGDKPLTLFVRPRDKEREIWNGRRAGTEGAMKAFGADVAHEISKLDEELPRLVGNSRTLFYRLGGYDAEFDARMARMLRDLRARSRSGQGAPYRIEDPGQIVHELRLRKEPHELQTLRKAAELTRRGHVAAMKAGKPGVHEYELQSLLEREFRGGGARGCGYYPIVASGANATVLHYNDNCDAVAAGSLVLIDAGAEVDLYTADVTRTFPASGKFTEAQRACYQLVLDAADEVIRLTKPGATIDGLHDVAVRVLTAGMVKLGLLKGDVETLVKENAFRKYYMHRTSHWLGLDVHDVGSYKDDEGKPRALEPGMLFTVEPGLYIAQDDETAAPEFRGIGIRIEDDLLVTPEGYENLTAATPRTVADVEACCSR